MSASRRVAFLYVCATVLLAVVLSFAGVFAVFREVPELTEFLFVLYVFFLIVPGHLVAGSIVLLSSAPKRLWKQSRNSLASAYLVFVAIPSVLAYVFGVLVTTLLDPRREYFAFIERVWPEILLLAVSLAALLIAGLLLLPLLTWMRASETKRMRATA